MTRKKKGSDSKYRNKRGNAVLDSLTIVLVLFVFIVFTLLGSWIMNIFNDDVQADDDMTNFSKEIMSEHQSRYGNFFDGLFMLFFVLVWGLMLVASFKVDTHPIFFIFTIILLVIIMLIGAYIGNLYEEFAADDELSTVTPQFPMANYIMTHLLTTIIVIGFSIVLVLFAKNRSNG